MSIIYGKKHRNISVYLPRYPNVLSRAKRGASAHDLFEVPATMTGARPSEGSSIRINSDRSSAHGRPRACRAPRRTIAHRGDDAARPISETARKHRSSVQPVLARAPFRHRQMLGHRQRREQSPPLRARWRSCARRYRAAAGRPGSRRAS